MAKRYTTLFAFILLVVSAVQAQTFKAWQTAAENAYAQKDYYSALEYFNILLEIEPEHPEFLWKYAESARQFDAYTLADSTYAKVRVLADSLYPAATYRQAEMKYKVGDFVQAQTLYQEYIDKYTNADFTLMAKEAIEDLNWTIEMLSEPRDDIEIDRLGDEINTDYSEFAAVSDDGTLYYSSFQYTNEKDEYTPNRQFAKVYQSKDNAPGTWANINSKDSLQHTAHTAFNSDRTKVYYTLCKYVTDVEIRCELYVSDVDDSGNFSEPKRLPDPVNSRGDETTQPSIGMDEETGYELLFFVSDRDGGKGNRDIWCSIINQNGEVSKPINIDAVNSLKDDITPFFHSKSQTLYFSSEGFQGLGGHDIFKSIKENDTWTAPENMKAPLNTTYNETHYWLNEGELQAYFSSNRPGSKFLVEEKEACCYDIYTARILSVDLTAFSFNALDSAALNGTKLTLYEIGENGELIELTSSLNPDANDFDFTLKTGKSYVLLAEKDGFLPLRDTIDLTNLANLSSRNIERELYLEPEILEFEALTYDSESKLPLKKVTIRTLENGEEFGLKINEKGNDFAFKFKRDKNYIIIASRPGWFPDTLILNMAELKNPLRTVHEFYLQEKSIEDLVPMVLFFDNDQPNPRTMKTTSEKSYGETAGAYYAKKPVFLNEYLSVLEGRDSFLWQNRIETFFEREIKDGNENLTIFSERLVELLGTGQVIKIYIRGYASPRGNADYNLALGQRRVDCVRNNFDRYAGGALIKYLNNGQLKIEEKSFGESQAPERVIKFLDDEREGIYSLFASRERRVQIVGIRLDDGVNVKEKILEEGSEE